uniref:Ig-like domain-containing protein n=1 Tax=Catharus ustulatus TaxID=91951 RepID=A0A8C3UHE6_CATUS
MSFLVSLDSCYQLCPSVDCGLFLLSAAISLAGAATLEQPKELTVREGGAVSIPCDMKGDSMRYYTMSWYRQGPSGEQIMKHLLHLITGQGWGMWLTITSKCVFSTISSFLFSSPASVWSPTHG